MSDSGKIKQDLYKFIYFSGSTCISILTYGRKIYVANVGDSRAVIARVFNDCKIIQE